MQNVESSVGGARRLSPAVVAQLVRRKEEMQERARNLRRSLRGKAPAVAPVSYDPEDVQVPRSPESCLPRLNNDVVSSSSSVADSEPDLPAPPRSAEPTTSIVISDNVVVPRARVPRRTGGQPSTRQAMSSSELNSDATSGTPSSLDTLTEDSGGTATPKRYRRGLASIRDPNAQMLANTVSQRVQETIIFDNAFPSEDQFARMFADGWRQAESEAGFTGQ